jgi:hypothetical protein
MIVETDHFDIVRHTVDQGKEKKYDYLVYSYVVENHMDFSVNEDVLMIYSNKTNKRIYFEKRFLTKEAGGEGVNLEEWLKDWYNKQHIVVLGYYEDDFINKYFTVVL